MRGRIAVVVVAVLCGVGPSLPAHAATPAANFGGGVVVQARASEPVTITGADIPSWSRAAATGVPAAAPSGVSSTFGGDNARSAHNGVITVPPDQRTGVNPDDIAAYRWTGSAWLEVPVQVDQMFPYFLANGHSSFSFYSGTDTELTYAWNPTAHSTGEESWKKVFGGILGVSDASPCDARYQLTGAAGQVELAQAIANGVVSPSHAPGVIADDYTQAMPDPVITSAGQAELNDDDQITMMAGDAGVQAPSGRPQPAGTQPGNGQQVAIVDPTAASDGSAATSYIYLFLQPGGSHFNAGNGYVSMVRDGNANEWVDRYTWGPGDPERIGISNTGYGPNIGGDVCRTAANNDASPQITTPDGSPRPSIDRQPRDGMTVTTPTYTVSASGRWMVRSVQVGGTNLISRWKGRAFQSSPNSTVSLVGFEDEQTNWELNSALLGWKVGPVRAIREIWGADSGTNVTKTEFYYRDGFDFSYHVRVHPIPPDGLYTSWDFRYGAVQTYYNQKNTAGLAIDGRNTQNAGEVDQVPVSGQPAFFNTCVPTQDICTAIFNPEEVSGNQGSLVFVADLTAPTTVLQPAVVPFYRDDACFDDGTGDSPFARPWPGEASTSSNVQNGYVQYWRQHTGNSSLTYADLQCAPPAPGATGYQQLGFATPTTMPFQAAIGEMGLHFFFTADSDNAFLGVPLDEIDAEQWVYTVPSSAATNFISPTASPPGEDYGANVVLPLQALVSAYGTNPSTPVPEAPLTWLIPLGVLAAGIRAGTRLRARRRSA